MRILHCHSCGYDKPSSEFYRKNRQPPVCVRCVKGKKPKQSRFWLPERSHTAVAIPKPERESEFETQAFLLYSLRDMGFEVYPEVTLDVSEHHRKRAMFDLVIYDGIAPVRVIEVKRSKASVSSSQIDFYVRFCDLDVIVGRQQAHVYLTRCSGCVLPAPQYYCTGKHGGAARA